jgi:hypothetical protein
MYLDHNNIYGSRFEFVASGDLLFIITGACKVSGQRW